MYMLKTDLPVISAERIRAFRPKNEWFLRGTHGVHGLSHETRVLILTQILQCAAKDEAPKSDADTLGWAAAFHDTRRQDEWEDPEHGDRAADFVIYMAGHWEGDFIPKVNWSEIAWLCRWHVPPDHKCPQHSINDNFRIFKDADALDRWRIGDLDPDYLRLKTSYDLLQASQSLWRRTRSLDYSDTAFDDIITEATSIGLLK